MPVVSGDFCVRVRAYACVPGQIRLRDAKVLVVGAGGLGCPTIMFLAGRTSTPPYQPRMCSRILMGCSAPSSPLLGSGGGRGGVGAPHHCSLGAAPCYLLFMLTRAIMMPSLFQRPLLVLARSALWMETRSNAETCTDKCCTRNRWLALRKQYQ